MNVEGSENSGNVFAPEGLSWPSQVSFKTSSRIFSDGFCWIGELHQVRKFLFLRMGLCAYCPQREVRKKGLFLIEAPPANFHVSWLRTDFSGFEDHHFTTTNNVEDGFCCQCHAGEGRRAYCQLKLLYCSCRLACLPAIETHVFLLQISLSFLLLQQKGHSIPAHNCGVFPALF